MGQGLVVRHSVVVVGISEDRLTIMYQDPNPENKNEQIPKPTSQFLREWGDTLNAQIRIDIVEDPRLLLPDYFEREENDEK